MLVNIVMFIVTNTKGYQLTVILAIAAIVLEQNGLL